MLNGQVLPVGTTIAVHRSAFSDEQDEAVPGAQSQELAAAAACAAMSAQQARRIDLEAVWGGPITSAPSAAAGDPAAAAAATATLAQVAAPGPVQQVPRSHAVPAHAESASNTGAPSDTHRSAVTEGRDAAVQMIAAAAAAGEQQASGQLPGAALQADAAEPAASSGPGAGHPGSRDLDAPAPAARLAQRRSSLHEERSLAKRLRRHIAEVCKTVLIDPTQRSLASQ